MIITKDALYVLTTYNAIIKEFLDLTTGNLYLWYDISVPSNLIDLNAFSSQKNLPVNFYYEIKCAEIREILEKYLTSKISILDLLNTALKFNLVSFVVCNDFNTDFIYDVVIENLYVSNIFKAFILPLNDSFLGYSVSDKVIVQIRKLPIPSKIISKFPNIQSRK